ncbi:MAG TPA: MBOAT family protein [Planctomycetota bacterium]|nr:MBOAT family protein [Planctomycetota bacterium]
MVFSSHIFLFWFLPLVLLVYYASPRPLKTLVLCLFSFLFYGWWRPDFILLMLFSASVDFFIGLKLSKSEVPRTRKLLLWLSCAINLGLLGYFKYANFGVDSLNALMARFDLGPIGLERIILPVGISFYTFQSMSYTIDLYRREVPVVKNPIDFLAYVSLFPQLVAGPIVRYSEISDQLRERVHSLSKFATGVLFLMSGFMKKILIADTLSPVATEVFSATDPSMADAWVGTLAYTLQIYFDFSGYSDMAIGLGMMIGFVFPINFDSPYKSQSITEFWRRWHISLSTWLRDYLYVPLGGNRGGSLLTYRNLALTMLLGGFWHGANWTFIAWGAYQGLWLAFERLTGKKPLYATLPRVFRVSLTMIIVMVGWIFFRADNWDEAMRMLTAFFGFGDGGFALQPKLLDRMATTGLILGGLVAFLAPNTQQLVANEKAWWWPTFLAIGFLIAIGHMFFDAFRPFLYFQF